MRNLKKLFAVLLTVAMIASMMVPALAGSYEGEGTKLQQIGLVAGDTPEQLDLDREMKRIEAVAFVIRAAGKEKEALSMTDEEVAEILAGWKDANEFPNWPNDNARKYGAYAIKAGIVVGMSSTEKIFAPNSLVKGIDFLVLLLKSALGYSKVNVNPDSENYVVEVAIDSGILQAGQVVTYASKTALIRDDAIHILYSAVMGGVNADGVKLIDALIDAGAVDLDDAIDAGFVEGLAGVTLTAVGARKLKVSFNVAVDSTKAVIEVKRGTVKPSVKSITWDKDNKSAVVEFNSDLVAGDYTVTVTGLTDEALTATTKVEAAKLTTIKYLNDFAIRNNNGSQITFKVVAENQYGEDITKNVYSRLTISNTKGYTNSDSTVGNRPSIGTDGKVTIKGAPDTFKVDETLVVTIVDSQTSTVATKTLVIAQAAQIASIEFGELTTDDKDLQGKEINVSTFKINYDKYYLPIVVKDQYGNAVGADILNDVDQFQLLSSNGNIIAFGSPIFDEDDDVGTFVTFGEAGNDSGTVVITAIATGTGKSASKTIVVKKNPEIDVITINAPESELKQGKEAVLPVELVDSYGSAVDLYDLEVLTGDGTSTLTLKIDSADNATTITATNATFSVTTDYIKKVKTVKLTPADTAKVVVLTATSATGKTTSLTLSVSDKPVPTSIKGIDPDVVLRLANVANLETEFSADDVILLDQYGEEIGLKTGYTLEIAGPSTGAKTELTTDSAIKVLSGATAGTDTYTVTLKKASEVIETYEFKVTVIAPKDIKVFGIEDLNKIYVGTTDNAYDQAIEIYGLVSGNKVVVPQTWMKHVSATGAIAGQVSTSGYDAANLSSTVDAGDHNAVITVLVDNGDATYTVTKDVVYSKDAPKAQSVVVKYDGKTVSAESLEVDKAELANKDIVGGNSKLQIVAKDQYGVTITTGFSFVVTNNNTSVTSINIDAGGVINLSGGGFTSDDNGKTFKLNIFIDGIYKALTIYVK